MDDAVVDALATDRTVDITTTGRYTGEPRRIEIWQHPIGGRNYITGRPGSRGWYANVRAEPHFTFHLKDSAQADLPALAHPIIGVDERRVFFTEAFAQMRRDLGDLDRWIADSPLIEVEFLVQDA